MQLPSSAHVEQSPLPVNHLRPKRAASTAEGGCATYSEPFAGCKKLLWRRCADVATRTERLYLGGARKGRGPREDRAHALIPASRNGAAQRKPARAKDPLARPRREPIFRPGPHQVPVDGLLDQRLASAVAVSRAAQALHGRQAMQAHLLRCLAPGSINRCFAWLEMPLGKSPESEPVEYNTEQTPTVSPLEYHRSGRDLGCLSLASGFRGPAP